MAVTHVIKFMRVFSLIIAFFVCYPVLAAEVIHDYHARIHVQDNGGLHITETIEVTAEGNKIKRGIYRDLPLYRRTFMGGILPLHYQIVSVFRNGEKEAYHTEISDMKDILRLYIGKRNVFLDKERYAYEITYIVPNQVFFFDSYDELYWNAIGTGWDFPIEHGSAEIILPNNAQIWNYSVYTGKAFSRGNNFHTKNTENKLYVQTNTELRPYEGLTVAVAFDKGVIFAPDDMVGISFFWKQHPGLKFMLAGFLVLAFYYYMIWRMVGIDPKSRGLAPFYTPPKRISPAMASVIHTMGSADRNKCMTAAIVSLASKGYITINEKSSSHYIISNNTHSDHRNSELSEDERFLYSEFKEGITIKSSSENLVEISSQHRSMLSEFCHKKYFFKNTLWWLGGVGIALLFIVFFGIIYSPSEQFWIGLLFALVFGIVSGVAVIYGLKQVFTASSSTQKAGGIFLVLWGSMFSIGGFMGLYFLMHSISWLALGVIIAMIILVVNMRFIMKAPTKEGRDIMDQLNGLKYYMEAVEEKVLKVFDPPEMSRELYEKYLPYAVALGVESKWADKFALSVAGATVVAGAVSTVPSWYKGSFYGADGFCANSMINSFSNTLSAASTSNSSGSSGGGFSGGGGGGGGGGGW